MNKLEIIPKAIAEKLDAHLHVIHKLIAAQRRGAAEQFGYAFLAGRALLQAKSIVPNGNTSATDAGFKHWVEANLPEITMRTAENWMRFAESILARAQTDAVSSPLLLGSIELNGDSHDSILQIVPEVMDGKGMMRFMRETRLLRMPKRSRGTPPKPLSALEANRHKSAQARRAWENLIVDLLAGTEILPRIENAEDLKRYLATLIEIGNKIRGILRQRKSTENFKIQIPKPGPSVSKTKKIPIHRKNRKTNSPPKPSTPATTAK
jgi:hypothetical protein